MYFGLATRKIFIYLYVGKERIDEESPRDGKKSDEIRDKAKKNKDWQKDLGDDRDIVSVRRERNEKRQTDEWNKSDWGASKWKKTDPDAWSWESKNSQSWKDQPKRWERHRRDQEADEARPSGSAANSSRTSDFSGSTVDWTNESAMEKERERQLKIGLKAHESKVDEIRSQLDKKRSESVPIRTFKDDAPVDAAHRPKLSSGRIWAKNRNEFRELNGRWPNNAETKEMKDLERLKPMSATDVEEEDTLGLIMKPHLVAGQRELARNEIGKLYQMRWFDLQGRRFEDDNGPIHDPAYYSVQELMNLTGEMVRIKAVEEVKDRVLKLTKDNCDKIGRISLCFQAPEPQTATRL